MAILKPAHAAAIARLRSYVAPPTRYYSLPLSRRAAVLILLYGDQNGELRVVLTMRARGLNSYGGHSSFPGGRADSMHESPFQTARREAHEEIGLPQDDSKIPPPFRLEHLCQLPANLARTELGVRPCIAYLSPKSVSGDLVPSVEDAIIPQLDAREVAAVFTAPFYSFLKQTHGLDHISEDAKEYGVETTAEPAQFYRGAWTDWHEARWRMHSFYVPVGNQVITWSPESQELNSKVEKEPAEHKLTAQGGIERFRVFGMTARILVDAARLAFNEKPEFEHNSAFGDEDMIGRLLKVGRLSQIRKQGDELTKEDMVAAARL